MTRTESIASLYATTTGKTEANITKSDLDAWLNLDTSISLETINASMLSATGALTYPAGTDAYVKAIFEAVFGYMPDENADGFAYWVNELDSGKVSADTLAIALLNGAAEADQQRAIDKVDAAIGNLTAAQTINMTSGDDSLVGGAGNDTFNSSTSRASIDGFDTIDGGAGEDTLHITTTGSTDPILVATKSVETLVIRAQDDTVEDTENNMDDTNVDADLMVGTNRYESNNSRSDVVIEDVRIEAAQITKDVTVAMIDTDPGNVDFGVYFDQQSLVNAPTETAGAGIDIQLMDLTAIAAGNDPLNKNPYNKILFTLDGVEVHLEVEDAYIHGTYDNLLEGVQKALADYNVIYPASEYPDASDLSTVTAAFNGTFTGINSDNSQSYTGQTITLTTSDDRIFAAKGFLASGVSDPVAEILARQPLTDPSASSFLITSTIILDNVGRGSMGGDLVVGGLSTGVTSDSKGVEQFNITVEKSSELQEISSTNNTLKEVYIVNGTETGNLTVAGQTNNDVNTVPGSQGTAGFTDVRVIDASTMTGSVTLNAELTSNIVSKYMNSKDIANDVAADDIDFVYTLTGQNDTLVLDINQENFDLMGTTTREDMNLVINAGNGNDTITTTIGDATGVEGDNWYENSTMNANLTVNAGAGDDTVKSTGAGDFTINAGTGSDTIYADNSGATHTEWTVNSSDNLNDDLESNLANANSLLYKAGLTVTYSGATLNAADLSAAAGVTTGAANSYSNGFESKVTIDTTNYLGNNTQINQAIKNAINNDAVLSKLLVVNDGPANTIVIDSLVDGEFDLNDLQFEISAATLSAMSTSEQESLDTAWELLNNNSAQAALVQADLTTAATNAATALNANIALTENGVRSTASSDNKIDLSTGNDVVVLGTGEYSNDTVVVTGYNNDTNTIVNFSQDGTGNDRLDISSFLTTKISASKSTESQVSAATTYHAVSSATGGTVTVDANDVAIVDNFLYTTSATGVISDTWSSMSASDVLDAFKNNSTTEYTGSYGNLTDGDLNVSATTNLVGSTQKHVVLIENNANDGEYKTFELTSTVDSLGAAEFTASTLIGTYDFGDSIDNTIFDAVVEGVPAVPVPGKTSVVLSDAQADTAAAPMTLDASTADNVYTFTNAGTDTFNISGFATGDTLDIVDTYTLAIDTYANGIQVGFYDAVDFDPVTIVNLATTDAALITAVGVAADATAADTAISAVWGADWLM